MHCIGLEKRKQTPTATYIALSRFQIRRFKASFFMVPVFVARRVNQCIFHSMKMPLNSERHSIGHTMDNFQLHTNLLNRTEWRCRQWLFDHLFPPFSSIVWLYCSRMYRIKRFFVTFTQSRWLWREKWLLLQISKLKRFFLLKTF